MVAVQVKSSGWIKRHLHQEAARNGLLQSHWLSSVALRLSSGWNHQKERGSSITPWHAFNPESQEGKEILTQANTWNMNLDLFGNLTGNPNYCHCILRWLLHFRNLQQLLKPACREHGWWCCPARTFQEGPSDMDHQSGATRAYQRNSSRNGCLAWKGEGSGNSRKEESSCSM